MTAHGVESDCNERPRGLFNGHCGCRQRFGRSILSIGTSTPHSGHLTVFVSSISMRMADAKEKAHWERARPTPAIVPMVCVIGSGLTECEAPKGAEGRFRRVQKFCEGGRNALLFGLTCQDKAHDSFPILCRSLGSARDANNCKYTQGACE